MAVRKGEVCKRGRLPRGQETYHQLVADRHFCPRRCIPRAARRLLSVVANIFRGRRSWVTLVKKQLFLLHIALS